MYSTGVKITNPTLMRRLKTSVLYANVVNVTETQGSHIIPKLQLFLEEKPRGIGGRWQWHDTTLHFEKGEWTNHGESRVLVYPLTESYEYIRIISFVPRYQWSLRYLCRLQVSHIIPELTLNENC